ncbi:MAG: GDP-mannose 4,6-dehydratase, partial [Euryarchaeota archaeon]|nr:GDP-mannose 4,6-dehydratase [Euryarchaeota archaeon]
RFVEQALRNEPITVFGDGSQTRSFCYVSDQIEALLRFAFSEGLDGKTLNIGNDEEITIVTLAGIIKKLTSSKSEIKFEALPKDDPLRRRPDINKARHLLNWKPRVSLEQGLERTIQWFRMK